MKIILHWNSLFYLGICIYRFMAYHLIEMLLDKELHIGNNIIISKKYEVGKLNKVIGSRIKELRINKKMTLKELSEKTDLSTGFLSQLERGLTSVATDSLLNIAEALEVDLSYFLLGTIKKRENFIKRSYEREIYKLDDSNYINYLLSNHIEGKEMLPRLIDIIPFNKGPIEEYNHEGEEFIYVLEGIITLFINGVEYSLYPGDTAHFHGGSNHCYINYTNKMGRILLINTKRDISSINNGRV